MKFKSFVLSCLVALLMVGTLRAAGTNVLIMYDGSGQWGWIGGLHARMLANLLGHFDLPYQIQPVENYAAGQMGGARATFYFGSVYDNPLPAAFKTDAASGANPLCWFKYNLWQVASTDFNTRFGFQFTSLDSSGYSNIVYKGESFLKNQLDPELGLVTVLNSNLVQVPITAAKASGAAIPYAIHGGNLWYIADTPFDYISEEDRYVAFCDLLHDILGINHAVSHRALMRIEDVGPSIYTAASLKGVADLLHTEAVPFEIALIPFYRDPLGANNDGVPEQHRLSDTADTVSTKFVSSIRYMQTNGAQLVIHGYTHQYDNVINPYTGVSADDFEFWRETFSDPDTFTIDIYSAVPEDSAAYALGRFNAAKTELANVGMTPMGWEFPHYAASAIDSQVAATNFPMCMNRALYFDDAGHVAGQFFPYIINRDIYGQRIIPENIGNIEPTPWADYPARLPADLIRASKKNLVVRDGWSAGYFHPYYSLTYLQQVVEGVKALGFTYVPIPTNAAPVNFPPTITDQPVGSTNTAGTAASFTVGVSGTAPLRYQWRFNNGNINGATNASYSIASVTTNNAGSYTVVVTNNYGTATSLAAVLVVLPAGTAASITTPPHSLTNNVGTTAAFSVVAAGTAPLRYQWRFNGGNINGATNTSYSIASVTTNNAGAYTVVVTNNFGTATSAAATLVVVAPAGTAPGITTPPQSLTNNVGTPASFSVTASGTAPLRYQWRFNGGNISGATNTSYSIASVTTNNAGAYTVVVTNNFGTATSVAATLVVVAPSGTPPNITAPPQSRTNNAGTAASFSVTATGTAPLRYQWRFNGGNISGATNTSYTIASVTTNNTGSYSVVVTNNFGTATSAAATLTVVVPSGAAPVITAQPVGLTNAAGTSATFSVAATGSATLRYQWRLNGVNRAGATSASLTIANVRAALVGDYTVVITNSFGSVTSSVAVLALGAAPTITVQPKPVMAIVGQPATFSVTAGGVGPFAYQWRHVGDDIAGATNASVTLPSVKAADAGNYRVLVTNPYGKLLSDTAKLTVR